MKKLNLGTAIYSLVTSIIFLLAPLITLAFVVDEVVTESNSGSSISIDMFFRVLAALMILFSIILLIKDRKASTAGKILILISGAIIVIFSSFMGTISGIVGIVGASLLLASNKRYNVSKNAFVETN